MDRASGLGYRTSRSCRLTRLRSRFSAIMLRARRLTSQILLSVTAERDQVVGVSQVFAQQFADRRAARRIGPLAQARIEIELGGDAVECHEKGEEVDYQLGWRTRL